MEVRTFWNILLKFFGLWLLLESLYLLPSYISTSALMFDSMAEDVIVVTVIFVLIAVVYAYIVRLFIFNTDKIIHKLKLADSIEEKRISLDISYTKILSVAVIVIGAIVLASSIPSLIQELIQFFQQKLIFREYPETGWIIYHIIKCVIGYLLMTNSQTVVKYIDRKSTPESN